MSILNPELINRREKEIIQNQLERLTYPFKNDDDAAYFYETALGRRDLDKVREEYVSRGKGFIITKPQKTTKKDMKDPNSIYSSRFGQTLQDVNPFADRYRCKCHNLEGRINLGVLCPICKEKVRYVDDDYDFYGFMVLQENYHIIHPNLYKSIEFYIGKDNLAKILDYNVEKDIDGHIIKNTEINKNEPFAGIGMIEFMERFDEIIDFYRSVNRSKSAKKEDYYADIMENRDKVFTQTICVMTTLLRPFQITGKGFSFEKTNSIYNMMARLVSLINTNKLRINRKRKQKNQLLWDLQCKQQELYQEIEDILSGKKGIIRGLLGGRYQFTSRDVIVPDKTLKIDEVSLPYVSLVELLQQTIINLLQKIYNLSCNDAYNIWYNAQSSPDNRVVSIIENLLKKRKVHVLINRNPTISYGSMLQMDVVKMTYSYTMGLNSNILPLIEGDVCFVLYRNTLEIETRYKDLLYVNLTVKSNRLVKFQFTTKLLVVA